MAEAEGDDPGEEIEPRQRAMINFKSQVLLEELDQGWCEHCGATMVLKQLSTAG